eukprot:scaffold5266_cov116-Isochrysis_galbana.AAC.5
MPHAYLQGGTYAHSRLYIGHAFDGALMQRCCCYCSSGCVRCDIVATCDMIIISDMGSWAALVSRVNDRPTARPMTLETGSPRLATHHSPNLTFQSTAPLEACLPHRHTPTADRGTGDRVPTGRSRRPGVPMGLVVARSRT